MTFELWRLLKTAELTGEYCLAVYPVGAGRGESGALWDAGGLSSIKYIKYSTQMVQEVLPRGSSVFEDYF